MNGLIAVGYSNSLAAEEAQLKNAAERPAAAAM
jgi:hypothetical protein